MGSKSFNWVKGMFDFFTDFANLIKENTEEEIENIKKRLVGYMMLYSLFMVAVFFIVLGLVKILSQEFLIFTEGTGYVVAGALIMVLLSAYTFLRGT